MSARYFEVLGVSPLLGRTWTDEEARPGAAPVVVLGQRLWEQHYGADRSLVGRTILVNETPHTVLGVMPATFRDLDLGVGLWQPVSFNDAALRNRTNAYLGVIGRLKDGVTPAHANAELAATARELERTHGTPYRDWTFEAIDLRTRIVGPVRSGLLLLSGAVGCVILITCANLAGLTLVRTAGRRRELAIRSALGASRARLVRQLLTESLLVALAGGAVGLSFGQAALALVLASLPAGWLPLAENVSLNPSVLAGALALTLLTALAVGLVPGLAASRVRPDDALKEGARGSSSSRSARRIWLRPHRGRRSRSRSCSSSAPACSAGVFLPSSAASRASPPRKCCPCRCPPRRGATTLPPNAGISIPARSAKSRPCPAYRRRISRRRLPFAGAAAPRFRPWVKTSPTSPAA